MANAEPVYTEEDYVDATGHRVYRGSRMHTPKMGEPTKCEVDGCPRTLGQQETSE